MMILLVLYLLNLCRKIQITHCQPALWLHPEPFLPGNSCVNRGNCEPLRVRVSFFFFIYLLIWISSPDSIYCCYYVFFFQIQLFHNGDWKSGYQLVLGREDCETREELGSIVCPKINVGARCSLFSPWGTRVTSCSDISQDDSIFAVSERELFMLPTKGIGYRAELYHLASSSGKPIVIETISESPRIFKIYNFFNEEEANAIIEQSLQHAKANHGNGRSNKEASIFSSDFILDRSAEVSSLLRRRASDMLGIFPMEETLMTGLKVCRF
jgi:hypothetical protein